MTPLVDALSEREERVLVLLGEGLSLEQIAARMGRSWYTVRDYRDSARAKLGAANQTQAVAIVTRLRERAPA